MDRAPREVWLALFLSPVSYQVLSGECDFVWRPSCWCAAAKLEFRDRLLLNATQVQGLQGQWRGCIRGLRQRSGGVVCGPELRNVYATPKGRGGCLSRHERVTPNPRAPYSGAAKRP